MNNTELVEKIIHYLGGKKNIEESWHCITRLRFNLVDKNLVSVNEINSLKGVIGSQFSGDQFQIIIGANVSSVFQELEHQLENSTELKKENQNILNRLFDIVSGIFNPLMPAIIGSGLIKGLIALGVVLGLISSDSSTYQVLYMFSDGVFYFLPFFVAMTAAKKFKAKPSLALVLAAILLYPTLINGASEGISSLSLFGLPIPVNNYSSSVLPIILGVFLLSYVNKYIDKIIPKIVNVIFSPMLTILITAPILLFVIAPLGNFLGNYLQQIFTTLFAIAGPVAGLLMGGLMPLIVLTGMHYAFFPGTFASLQTNGYDIMLLPMNLVANIAQAGAVLGVFFKAKNAELKGEAISTFIPAIFGITEPAIYGVTLKLKRPFYASMIGGAVGGAIFGTFAVKTISFAQPGITALPTYIIENSNNFIFALIGYAISFLVAFILTLIIGIKEPILESDDVKETSLKNSNQKVVSPVSGIAVPLESLEDETFSTDMMGKGTAIEPTEGIIYSPFKGKIKMTTPTKHAIGIESDEGVELLIHVGIDTVNLKGEFFDYCVSSEDEIDFGSQLIKFNLEKIKEAGYSCTVIVIVTNTSEYLDVFAISEDDITALESQILICIK